MHSNRSGEMTKQGSRARTTIMRDSTLTSEVRGKKILADRNKVITHLISTKKYIGSL